MYKILQNFLERAQDVDRSGIGHIKVVWRDSHSCCDLLGRRKSGVAGMDELPEGLKRTEYAGVSAFAFPRIIRTALRHGIPGLHDIDTVNAHFQFLWNRLGRHGLREEYPVIGMYVADCKGMRAMYAHESTRVCARQITPSMVKNLLIRMQYGGGFDEWLLDCKVFDKISDPDDADKKEEYDMYLHVIRGLKDFFGPLMRELKKSRTAQARLYPEMFALFRAQFDDWKAEVKLHSHLNMDEERQVLDELEACVNAHGGSVMSYEHDGLAVLIDDQGLEAVLSSYSRAPIDVKKHDAMANLREHSPGEDWYARSSVTAYEYDAFRTDIDKTLEEGGCSKYGDTYAQFAVCLMEGLVYRKEKRMEEWDPKKLCWRIADSEENYAMVRKFLIAELQRWKVVCKHGHFEGVHPETPDPLKNETLYKNIITPVFACLKEFCGAEIVGLRRQLQGPLRRRNAVRLSHRDGAATDSHGPHELSPGHFLHCTGSSSPAAVASLLELGARLLHPEDRLHQRGFGVVVQACGRSSGGSILRRLLRGPLGRGSLSCPHLLSQSLRASPIYGFLLPLRCGLFRQGLRESARAVALRRRSQALRRRGPRRQRVDRRAEILRRRQTETETPFVGGQAPSPFR